MADRKAVATKLLFIDEFLSFLQRLPSKLAASRQPMPFTKHGTLRRVVRWRLIRWRFSLGLNWKAACLCSWLANCQLDWSLINDFSEDGMSSYSRLSSHELHDVFHRNISILPFYDSINGVSPLQSEAVRKPVDDFLEVVGIVELAEVSDFFQGVNAACKLYRKLLERGPVLGLDRRAVNQSFNMSSSNFVVSPVLCL